MKKSTKSVFINLNLEPYVELQKIANEHHLKIGQTARMIIVDYLKSNKVKA